MPQLDFYGALVAASFLVLLLGRGLVARVNVLRTYNSPEPVVGGLLVASLLLALREFEVRFDTSLRAPLILAFFVTIGLNAGFASVKRPTRCSKYSCWWSAACWSRRTPWASRWPRPWDLIRGWGCWPAPSPCPAAMAPGRLGFGISRAVWAGLRLGSGHRLGNLRFGHRWPGRAPPDQARRSPQRRCPRALNSPTASA